MAAIAGISLFAATGVLTAASAQEGQRIRIRMGDQTVTATLNDSEAARDLVAMLPLSIRMRDHLGREKTGRLPGPLSERTKGSPSAQREARHTSQAIWVIGGPGGNFVIFYRHDGLTIPSPGIVRLGRLVSGTEIFNVPGAIEVIVERIN
jgi:hypothetical protein